MENNRHVQISQEGDALRVTLNRPPVNFISTEMLQQIGSELESMGESPACKALILDSALPAFSAGLDLSQLTPDTVFLLLEELHGVARSLNSFPRPTIGLVRGMALGAGNELLACCDFVFASEKASFGHPEVKVGGIPSLAPLLLPPLIGDRRAREMILTGNFIGAKEAESTGLITRALPEARIPEAVAELLKTLGSLSLPVLAIALRSVRTIRLHEMDGRLREIEALYLNQLMNLEDPMEGVRAFLEKRQPVWRNK
ncbi:MAG TPA: enoyl-CoA hydratase/isomerase family protein [Acidobacteriota bacterium]|nr:enoyl-CoA hydratase/isomerase family protein [Acidobacteriota bacterium]